MASPLSAGEKRALLRLARASIRSRLTEEGPPDRALSDAELTERLGQPAATFVTLKAPDPRQPGGRLRGCIGSLEAEEPLFQNVIHNAAKSAFEDPRFPRVEASELDSLTIDISVLTPLREIAGPEEIVIGRDGVRLEKGPQSSVFLPQVAVENRWETPQMLEHLALKAGLPRDGWRGARLFVFQAEIFGEDE